MFGQLPDVVADDGDAIVEFGTRKCTVVAHDIIPGRDFWDEFLAKASTIRAPMPSAGVGGQGSEIVVFIFKINML